MLTNSGIVVFATMMSGIALILSVLGLAATHQHRTGTDLGSRSYTKRVFHTFCL